MFAHYMKSDLLDHLLLLSSTNTHIGKSNCNWSFLHLKISDALEAGKRNQMLYCFERIQIVLGVIFSGPVTLTGRFLRDTHIS